MSDHSQRTEHVLRIPPFIHRKLAEEAEEAGVSLNRLLSAKLATGS